MNLLPKLIFIYHVDTPLLTLDRTHDRIKDITLKEGRKKGRLLSNSRDMLKVKAGIWVAWRAEIISFGTKIKEYTKKVERKSNLIPFYFLSSLLNFWWSFI